jgi:hypothetical protein
MRDGIHINGRNGVSRHLWRAGFARILHDGEPTSSFDGPEPGRPVIELAAEDDTDDAWSVILGRRAKQRINGRPGPVFLWTGNDAHRCAIEHQMSVGRGDQDMPGLKGFTVFCMAYRERAGRLQNVRQLTGALRSDVPHNEHSCG